MEMTEVMQIMEEMYAEDATQDMEDQDTQMTENQDAPVTNSTAADDSNDPEAQEFERRATTRL